MIPCGATVSVTGFAVKEGNVISLAPLPKSLSIVTDRPWTEVMTQAGEKAKRQTNGVSLWFFAALAVGLSQLAIGLGARGKA